VWLEVWKNGPHTIHPYLRFPDKFLPKRMAYDPVRARRVITYVEDSGLFDDIRRMVGNVSNAMSTDSDPCNYCGMRS